MSPPSGDALTLGAPPDRSSAAVAPPLPAGSLPRSAGLFLAPRRLPTGGLLLGPVVLVAAWEFASWVGWLSPRFLASPSTAVLTGVDVGFLC